MAESSAILGFRPSTSQANQVQFDETNYMEVTISKVYTWWTSWNTPKPKIENGNIDS